MGWTFTHKPAGVGAVDILIGRINCDNPQGAWRVLRGAVVADTAYFAVDYLDKRNGKRQVFGLIMEIRYARKREDRPYNFGWKDCDETMLPFSTDCPESILKLLSPTENANALAWRESCRARASEVAQRRQFIRELQPGQVIRFVEPLIWRLSKRESIAASTLLVLDPSRRVYAIHEPGQEPVRVALRRRSLMERSFTVLESSAA